MSFNNIFLCAYYILLVHVRSLNGNDLLCLQCDYMQRMLFLVRIHFIEIIGEYKFRKIG